MPCSVRAVLHRTTALCMADKNSTNWLQIQSRELICFCIAQADFRLRLLLPHPPECCDYRSASPCLATSMILPTLQIIETPRFLAFMLPLTMNSLSWTHVGEFWICEALLFILVRLRLPHDQHFKWFTRTPPASSEITKLLQEDIDKPVPSALGWQRSPLI